MSAASILDAINEAYRLITPPPMFASSRILAADRALSFTVDNRQFVGAHPDFWRAAATKFEQREGVSPFVGIPINDLDADKKARAAFFDALAEAIS